MASLLKPALVIGALLLLGTAAVVVLARPDPGNMISFSGESPEATNESIPLGTPALAPPIDSAVPINTETATFAMG